MHTLHSSPMEGYWRCSHAPDEIAIVRSGSRGDQRHPNEGTASSARSESSSCIGQSGSRPARGADHGRAQDWAYRFVAHSRCVFAGRSRSGCVRHCANRPTTPVRHRCRSSGDGARLYDPANGKAALDVGRTRTCRAPGTRPGQGESRNRAPDAEKNDLKPWLKLMWCIGALTEEYRQRMYALLDLYARPLRVAEPVICSAGQDRLRCVRQ